MFRKVKMWYRIHDHKKLNGYVKILDGLNLHQNPHVDLDPPQNVIRSSSADDQTKHISLKTNQPVFLDINQLLHLIFCKEKWTERNRFCSFTCFFDGLLDFCI